METARHGGRGRRQLHRLRAGRAFRHHGLSVTWLIRGPRFLRRVLDEDGGALVDDIARAAGVDIHYGGEIAEVHSQGWPGMRRDHDHGEYVSCDLLGVGLGVKMNVDFLAGTPITVHRAS